MGSYDETSAEFTEPIGGPSDVPTVSMGRPQCPPQVLEVVHVVHRVDVRFDHFVMELENGAEGLLIFAHRRFVPLEALGEIKITITRSAGCHRPRPNGLSRLPFVGLTIPTR